jgi:hypothetical protein
MNDLVKLENIIKKIKYNEKMLINSSNLSIEELQYILKDYRSCLKEYDKYSELIEQIEKINFI